VSKQYTVKIALGVISHNLLTGDANIMSVDKNEIVLPYYEIDDDTNVQQIIQNLKEKYILLHHKWIAHDPKHFIFDNDELFLVYRAVIPFETPLNNAHWHPILNCGNNPVLQNIIKNIIGNLE
jgi:hypothetical protein